MNERGTLPLLQIDAAPFPFSNILVGLLLFILCTTIYTQLNNRKFGTLQELSRVEAWGKKNARRKYFPYFALINFHLWLYVYNTGSGYFPEFHTRCYL